MYCALGREGFEVGTARNGQLALDLLAEGFPADVLLVDLMMPLMDGRVLISRLSSGCFARIPVIVLSASLRPGEVVEGATASLAKPATMPQILTALQSALA